MKRQKMLSKVFGIGLVLVLVVLTLGELPASVKEVQASLTYNLTVDITGQGSVTIDGTTPTSYPNTTTWVNGTVVGITATPDIYWYFVNWMGDVADPNAASTNVTVGSNKTVTANFGRVNYTLIMAVNGTGTTNPASGTPYSYYNGTVVNITAIPALYWNFVNWTGDVVANASSASTNVTMDANKTVIANFIQVNYNLTVNVNGQGNVSINGTTPASYPNTTIWPNGTPVNINATPGVNYTFVNWTGNTGTIANANASNTTINVTGNYNITANFALAYTLTINVTPSGGGRVRANSTATSDYPSDYPWNRTYVNGTNVNLEAVANSSYKFSYWSGNVTEAQEDEYSINITMMDSNKTVTANFVANNTSVDNKGSDNKNVATSAPVANFSAMPTSGPVPLTVQFTDKSTNNPTSWSWTFGDGKTNATQNPKHTYTGVGTYTVTLRAYNSKGYGEKSDYITVTANGSTNGSTQPTQSLSLDILGTASTGQMNSTGKLLEAVTAASTGGSVSICIANGTVCRGSDGGRLDTITVSNVDEANLSAPENRYIIAAYKLEPSGARFTPALELTLAYKEEELPEGVPEKKLYIACYNDTTEKWSALKSEVDTENNTVTAGVGHFTTFAIIGKTTSWLGKYWWIIAVGVVVAVLVFFFGWWRRREEYYY